MKKPLLNLKERQAIRDNTFNGAALELKLAIHHVDRVTYKNGGYFAMRRARKELLEIINKRLFNA